MGITNTVMNTYFVLKRPCPCIQQTNKMSFSLMRSYVRQGKQLNMKHGMNFRQRTSCTLISVDRPVLSSRCIHPLHIVYQTVPCPKYISIVNANQLCLRVRQINKSSNSWENLNYQSIRKNSLGRPTKRWVKKLLDFNNS